MHRSKLNNIFHKASKEDCNNYKKQRNCVNLNFLHNTEKDYLQKLNVKDLTDNEKFMKKMIFFLAIKV